MPSTSSHELPDIIYVEKDEIKLDPRGLVRNDIAFIRKNLPVVRWYQGISLEEVAYNQGMHDCLKFIEEKVVGRRTD